MLKFFVMIIVGSFGMIVCEKTTTTKKKKQKKPAIAAAITATSSIDKHNETARLLAHHVNERVFG
jgi:hypothetical protein